MKVYTNLEQVEADIKDNKLYIEGNVEFQFDLNIDADIEAGNIETEDIKAGNIETEDIKARNINALNINYYAVCFAYIGIECASIKGKRSPCKHFCLDGEITIKPRVHTITIDGKEIELSEESFNNLKEQLT